MYNKYLFSLSQIMVENVFDEKPVCISEKFDCQNKPQVNFTTVTAETATPSSVFWKEFFPDEILDDIVVDTNQYQIQRPVRQRSSGHQVRWVPVDREEMRAFLAVTIVMKYNIVPEITDYWSNDTSTMNLLLKKTMSRDRFLDILSCIHYYDDAAEGNLKFCKILPVLKKLEIIFSEKLTPGPHITIDEDLFVFKGKLKLNQYVATKRAKVGVKVSRLSASVKGAGYALAFKMNYGKEDHTLPVQQDIVMELCRPLYGQGATLSLDSSFMCPELVLRLHSERFNVIGMILKNRLPEDLRDVKLKKKRILTRSYGIINYILWRGSRTVCLLSTMHPNKTVVDKKKKTKPKAMVDYDKWRARINVSDQSPSAHHLAFGSVNRYRKIFFYFFDAVLENTFIAYKLLKGSTRRCTMYTTFQQELAVETLRRYNQNKEEPPTVNFPVPRQKSLDRIQLNAHYPDFHPRRSCHVCYRKGVRTNTPYRCSICNVSLCMVPCYRLYHSVVNY